MSATQQRMLAALDQAMLYEGRAIDYHDHELHDVAAVYERKARAAWARYERLVEIGRLARLPR